MTVRIYTARLAAGSVPQVYRATFASSGATSRARIYKATFAVAPSLVQVYRATLATVGTSVPPVLDTIPAQTVDGFDTVTITPTSTPAATDWAYRVITGGVALNGSGRTRTFTAPATFDGTAVTVGVTGYVGTAPSAESVVTITVRPWNSWNFGFGNSDPIDILDANGGSGGGIADTVDGGTAASHSPNVIDGATAAGLTATIDGGTAASLATNVVDGGTDTNPPNTIDGGTGAGAAPGWYPRGPIHPIV